MQGLNHTLKDTLALSDNVPQQFPDFVAFLQRLDNQVHAQVAEKKHRAMAHKTNATP
jgi:hypothetical protein